MSAQMTHRLSANDAVFLYWERPEQPFHVCEMHGLRRRRHTRRRSSGCWRSGCTSFRDIASGSCSRRCSWGTRRGTTTPSSIWTTTSPRRRCPAPGDDRTLSLFCGELFGGLIDREHPLWHLTLIHGHESGHPVMFLKLHHAMVDGVSSVQLIEVLHSAERGSSATRAARREWQPAPLPSRSTLLLDARRRQRQLGRRPRPQHRRTRFARRTCRTTVARVKPVARVLAEAERPVQAATGDAVQQADQRGARLLVAGAALRGGEPGAQGISRGDHQRLRAGDPQRRPGTRLPASRPRPTGQVLRSHVPGQRSRRVGPRGDGQSVVDDRHAAARGHHRLRSSDSTPRSIR